MTNRSRKPSPPFVSLDEIITSELAGKLILVSAERVRQLANDGWIPKIGRDQYCLADVVTGYVKFLRDDVRRSTKSAAESRVQNARANEIEQRVALRSGDLMEYAEHLEFIDELCGLFRSELSGLPARLSRDLQERGKIEQVVYEILERLAARAREKAGIVDTKDA